MSVAVVAMRLRLALLRHKMPVDVDLLLADAAYAQEVLALCKDVGEPGLIALAESVVASLLELAPRELGGPPPEPGPSAAPNAKAQARTSDATDPHPPPSKRYLRGAR